MELLGTISLYLCVCVCVCVCVCIYVVKVCRSAGGVAVHGKEICTNFRSHLFRHKTCWAVIKLYEPFNGQVSDDPQ